MSSDRDQRLGPGTVLTAAWLALVVLQIAQLFGDEERVRRFEQPALVAVRGIERTLESVAAVQALPDAAGLVPRGAGPLGLEPEHLAVAAEQLLAAGQELVEAAERTRAAAEAGAAGDADRDDAQRLRREAAVLAAHAVVLGDALGRAPADLGRGVEAVVDEYASLVEHAVEQAVERAVERGAEHAADPAVESTAEDAESGRSEGGAPADTHTSAPAPSGDAADAPRRVDAAALLALDPALAEATWRVIERSREPEARLGSADVPTALRGLPELILLERTGDLPPADEWPVSEALGRAAPVFALAALAALPMLVGLALLLFTQRLLVPRAPLGARLDLGAGWLAFVGGQLGFAVLGSLLFAVGAGGVTGVQVLLSSTPIALAALWAAGWRRGGDVGAAAERLGLSGSLLEAPRAFAAGLAVLPLIGVGMLVPATLLADEASHWSNPYVDIVLRGGFEQWRLLALEAGVFAPIFEELAFRGVLFAALRARLSFAPAAAASSAIFAIAHPYDLAGALAILWVGAVLCWLYERTGSLVACMVAHSAFNLFQLSAMLVLV